MAHIIPNSKNILVVAGDISGDVHASNLIKELKAAAPDITVTSIGGERMKAASDEFLFDLIAQGATGFVEPFKKLPMWRRLLNMIKAYISEKNPAAVITVDFYGFNRQVLEIAKKRNIPAYYYVCPQVWASREYRAKTIVKLAKKMFVIFPFEKKIYTNLGGDALFLGNPLLDKIPTPKDNPFKGDNTKEWKIGLMPGSRPSEIKKHTKLFYDAFKDIKQSFPNAKAYMFALPEVSDEKLFELIGPEHDGLEIIRENDYSKRREMNFVITCSGTATLENALLGLPMLVVYKTGWVTYQIAKMIIKVPYISLVNILSRKGIVKEFIQKDANAKAIAQETCRIIGSEDNYNAMRAQLLKLRSELGEPGVAKRAAEIIISEVFPKE